MRRMRLGTDLASRMLKRRDVEWLADSLLRQYIGCQKFIRRRIRHDLSLTDDNDAVHIPVQCIFQTMLNNQDRCPFCLL